MSILPDEQREQQVDEILASYLKAGQLGKAPDRQALFARHPDLAPDLARFFADQDAIDRLTVPLRDVVHGRPPDAPGQMVGDYELLQEIAHGGMGVVYRARQKSLNRIVALKMLRAGPLATPEDRERFRTEAEAVAGLDHPQIVPIYEVGERDGQPYFSMKLLEGGSLAKNLDRYRIDPRAAARLLASVAEAIHYAHQHGILHRDLKPANILLDARGEPHVSDFGLAKKLKKPELGAGEANLSVSGAILGTPSYMAPEQAVGQKGTITTAVDVYSLGSILYEVLTGRPPFREGTLLDTLLALLEKEPPRPRTLNPRADRDLETICLKCLEKDPRRRYPSAQDLADDLHRYLAGESIQARRIGSQERFWRWCRRKPLVASLVAALLLTMGTGLGLVGWQWQVALAHGRRAEVNAQRAEDNARQAEDHLAEVNRQRAEVEKGFRLAHEAVRKFCTRVSEKDLLRVAGMQPVRKELLEDAVKYYLAFLEKRGADPKLERELADTYRSLGRINSALGNPAAALEADEKALALYKKLLEANPKDTDLQAKVAGQHHNAAVMHHSLGQPAAALAAYEQARSLYGKFLQASPDEPELLRGLIDTLINLGMRSQDTGHLADSMSQFEEARRHQEKLVALSPDELFARKTLAGIFARMAVLLVSQSNRQAEALANYQQARTIFEDLVRKAPQTTAFQHDLAEVCNNMGNAQRKAGQIAESRASHQQALTIREQLARDNPKVPNYQAELAHTHTSIAVTFGSEGNRKDSLTSHEKARAIREKLLRDNPNLPGLQRELAESWYNIGVCHADLSEKAEALLAYQQSRELLEKTVRADPENIGYRSALAGTLNNMGILEGQRGQLDKAMTTLRLAIAHQRVAFDRAPQVFAYRHALHSHYGSLAEVQRAANQPAEAVASTLERQKLWQGNGKELYRVAVDLARAAAIVGKGQKELTPAEQAERRSYLDLTVNCLREAVAGGFTDSEKLEKDKPLDLLRERDDFRKLLADVQSKAKP